jgi:hypothetical protein
MKQIIFLILVLSIGLAFAQEPANAQGQNQQQPAVIDLTERAITISARMELPQVKMFSRRLKPDFKEITMEKSFVKELSTQAEEIQFHPITSGKIRPIKNMEALLNKKRF